MIEPTVLADPVAAESDVMLNRAVYPKCPSQNTRMIEHAIEIDNALITNKWKSCCGLEMDSRAVIYFTTMFIIIGVIVFCIYQLIILDGCNDQQAYLGLLTFVLGIIIPSPKFTKK
jgi:hypothetical protein